MTELSNKVVLVTGGCGFLGTALARALVAAGASVRVLDIEVATHLPGPVNFHRTDIRDATGVARACDGVDIVFHCVSVVPLGKNRALFRSVNQRGTEVLLNACATAGVGKVVHLSSSAVFGVPERNPVTPETRPRPAEAYGRSKLAGERIANRYVREGLDLSIVRPRTIMGPGRLGIMQILFEWVHQGRVVPVLGRGDNIYQFVHVADLVDACFRVALRPGPGTYNVGAADFSTMRGTLQSLIDAVGSTSRVVSLPTRAMVGAMKTAGRFGASPLGPYHWLMYGESMFFDIAHVKEELDWTPRFTGREMFVENYRWYVENRDEILSRTGGSHHRRPVQERVLGLLRFLG